MKTKLLELTILSILVFTFSESGSNSQEANQSFKTDHYQTENFDVVIFPAESPDFFPGKGRFTPTRSEILSAENSLRTKLKALNWDKLNQSETPVIDRNLKKYKRQYFGYLDGDGRKTLFINCFWKREKEESLVWLRERISVLGGGSYFWSVKFRIAENELFDLDVNTLE